MREQESTEDDVLARLVERQTKALQELRTALEQKEREVEGLKQALENHRRDHETQMGVSRGRWQEIVLLRKLREKEAAENASLKARLAEAEAERGAACVRSGKAWGEVERIRELATKALSELRGVMNECGRRGFSWNNVPGFDGPEHYFKVILAALGSQAATGDGFARCPKCKNPNNFHAEGCMAATEEKSCIRDGVHHPPPFCEGHGPCYYDDKPTPEAQ